MLKKEGGGLMSLSGRGPNTFRCYLVAKFGYILKCEISCSVYLREFTGAFSPLNHGILRSQARDYWLYIDIPTDIPGSTVVTVREI